MKIVQKVSSRPDNVYIPNVMLVPSPSDIPMPMRTLEKSPDEIIQDIRTRYGIQTKYFRSTDTIDSLIQNSIGSSCNVAKPDYKPETTAPVRDYGKRDPKYEAALDPKYEAALEVDSHQRAKCINGETQTEHIVLESIGSQAQCMQSSVSLQADLLVLPTVSVGIQDDLKAHLCLQETQTSQQVVLLDDLEEIASFMDDVVHQVTCQKESKEVQTTDTCILSQCTQTLRLETLDIRVQTVGPPIKHDYSQTSTNELSEAGVQSVSKVSDFCFQTDSSEKVDIGLDPIIFPENDVVQYTKEQEEIFKQDFILNFLQKQLKEFTIEYEGLK